MLNLFIITEIKIHEGNSPGAARLMNIAKALAAKEVQVYLCSFMPWEDISNKSILEINKNIYVLSDKKETNRSLRHYVTRIFAPLFIFLWIIKILKASNDIRGHNVFYLYPVGMISFEIASLLVLKTIYGYKIYYDMNELRVAILYNRTLSQNMIRRFSEIILYPLHYFKNRLVDLFTKYFDGLVVISTNLEFYYKKFNRNVLRIPILCDVDQCTPAVPADYNQNDYFRLGFSGSIILKKEGFDCFYKALSIVKSTVKNIELHLYGPIVGKELLMNVLPSQYGIKENIFYHGIIKQDKLVYEIQKNHLLLIPRPLTLQTKYGFSTKLSEYLVSGIPVLVTDVSDNSLYIEDGYNGFIVAPGDCEKMAEKILFIISHYNSIRETIGKNAYDTAKKHFYYLNFSEKLYSFLFGNIN
jgi:glycosyltransferase involved in cell wall biosynthesis